MDLVNLQHKCYTYITWIKVCPSTSCPWFHPHPIPPPPEQILGAFGWVWTAPGSQGEGERFDRKWSWTPAHLGTRSGCYWTCWTRWAGRGWQSFHHPASSVRPEGQGGRRMWPSLSLLPPPSLFLSHPALPLSSSLQIPRKTAADKEIVWFHKCLCYRNLAKPKFPQGRISPSNSCADTTIRSASLTQLCNSHSVTDDLQPNTFSVFRGVWDLLKNAFYRLIL